MPKYSWSCFKNASEALEIIHSVPRAEWIKIIGSTEETSPPIRYSVSYQVDSMSGGVHNFLCSRSNSWKTFLNSYQLSIQHPVSVLVSLHLFLQRRKPKGW